MFRSAARTLILLAAVSALAGQGPLTTASSRAAQATPRAAATADYFQYPLPSWEPHCLSFGSEWRLCDGTLLRACSATGAAWLHTGVDIRTGIQPVMAAANGVIAGYIIDPVFRGGVLIRHDTAGGAVLTQYWHVYLRPGLRVGSVVTRGEVFADIADMGARTHLHFAVFEGEYEPDAWRGALPPMRCDGFPACPYRFVEPNAFLEAHLQPSPAERRHACRALADLGL